MGLARSLRYGFVTALAVFSLGAAAAQPEYIPGEVLIIPDTTFQASAVQVRGMSLLKTHKGRLSFSKVKVKPEQTVEQAVQALNNTPGILYAEPNYIYHAAAVVPDDPAFTNYWGLNNTGQAVNATAGTNGVDIGAVAAWNNLTDCSPIVVAVIDSGVDYNHPDLSSVIWNNTDEIDGNGIDDDGNGFVDDVRGWDFVQNDNEPMDFNEHGTHVAGTIGAAGNNGVGGVGVCWKSTIMPIRVLDSVGSGTAGNIALAVDYAVANGARIINMSFSGIGFSTPLLNAIAAANSAGVLVIAAAGNDGTDNGTTPNYPASYNQSNIISVAATDQNDALATTSNYGVTSVDMAAPGVNIYSTVPPARTMVTGCSWNFDDGTTQGWSVTDTVGVTTEDANSPSNSITDSPLATNYANNMQYEAWAPACNLTGKEGAVLEMVFNLDTVSPDGFYPAVFNGTTKKTLTGYTGNSGGWVSDSFDMTAWDNTSTARVGWILQTDASVVADGVHVDDVTVTIPGTTHVGSEYTFLNGTSRAAAHVSGVAALLWAAQPNLTVSEIRTLVINSGDPVSGLVSFVASGKRLNLNNGMPTGIPSGLSASSTSATSADLSWTDNATSEISYDVWRSEGAGFSSIATGLAADSTSYTDNTIPSETTVTYQVRAVGSTTVASNTATVISPPLAATGLSATATSSSTIALSWNDNSSVEANYRVMRSTGTGYVTVTALAVNSTSYTDTGLTPETTYSYQIVAANSRGITSTSSAASATTPAASSGGGGGALGGYLLLMLLPLFYLIAPITRRN